MSNSRIKGEVIGIHEFIEMMKKKQRKGETLKSFAKRLGKVSYQYLSGVYGGIYNPGPKIAKALGYKQIVAYQKVPLKPAKPANTKKPAKAPKQAAKAADASK